MTHFAPIAETAGLVDLVCDFFSELKRLEIWPEDFQLACSARRRDRREKDREILDLYQAYQQQLREHCLYDAEGRFWSARDWLKKSWSGAARTAGGRTPWPQLRLVVADGFTDFTRTQHEILDILAGGRKRSSFRSRWRPITRPNCSTSRCERSPSFGGVIRR